MEAMFVAAEVLIAAVVGIVSAVGVVDGGRAGGYGGAFVDGSGVSSGGVAAGGDNLCGGVVEWPAAEVVLLVGVLFWRGIVAVNAFLVLVPVPATIFPTTCDPGGRPGPCTHADVINLY